MKQEKKNNRKIYFSEIILKDGEIHAKVKLINFTLDELQKLQKEGIELVKAPEKKKKQ